MPDTQIAVRYCGGCSTTYDREAAVKQLQNLLPEYSFVIAEPGKRYRAALIVNGCSCACTSTLTLAVLRLHFDIDAGCSKRQAGQYRRDRGSDSRP